MTLDELCEGTMPSTEAIAEASADIIVGLLAPMFAPFNALADGIISLEVAAGASIDGNYVPEYYQETYPDPQYTRTGYAIRKTGPANQWQIWYTGPTGGGPRALYTGSSSSPIGDYSPIAPQTATPRVSPKSLAGVATPDCSSFTGAFPSGTLANAPTGATAVYHVASAKVGAVPEIDITAYQYYAFSPPPFNFASVQAGDFRFGVYAIGSTTILWSLDASKCVLAGDGLSVTVADADTHTQSPGTYRYVLVNTTTDRLVARGALTIEPMPNVVIPS